MAEVLDAYSLVTSNDLLYIPMVLPTSMPAWQATPSQRQRMLGPDMFNFQCIVWLASVFLVTANHGLQDISKLMGLQDLDVTARREDRH